MKQFKTIDVWISSILILIFSALALIKMKMIIVIWGYIIIGSWQVISMLFHSINGWFNEKRSKRRVYHWVTAVSLITMPIGSIFILLFIAPLMAIYYTWICFEEVTVKMKRPLHYLK